MRRAVQPSLLDGSRRRGRRTALAAALLAAWLGGCGLVPGGRGDDAGPATATLGGAAGTTTTGKGGLEPGAYTAALVPVLGDARASVGAIADAGGYGELRDRAGDAEAAVTGAAGRLAALDPPAAVAAEHAELIASLGDLSRELGAAGEAVGRRELCAAPAVMARVTGSAAAARVRAAGAALDRAGAGALGVPSLGAGALLPKATKRATRRLPDGTVLTDRRTGGLGRLRVDNRGATRDSVVSLVRGNRVVVAIYVDRGRLRTVTRIADGGYRAVEAAGVDYDRRLGAFTRDCSFTRFDETLRFTTSRTASTVITVSFRPVAGANARISEVDPDDFPSP